MPVIYRIRCDGYTLDPIESPLRHSIVKQKIEIRTDHEEGFTTYFADRELVVSGHPGLVKDGGVQALKRQISEDHIHANRTDQEIAEVIIEFSLENLYLGQVQFFKHLKKTNYIDISASGARQVWLRENILSIALRTHKKSELSAIVLL